MLSSRQDTVGQSQNDKSLQVCTLEWCPEPPYSVCSAKVDAGQNVPQPKVIPTAGSTFDDDGQNSAHPLRCSLLFRGPFLLFRDSSNLQFCCSLFAVSASHFEVAKCLDVRFALLVQVTANQPTKSFLPCFLPPAVFANENFSLSHHA